jgi:hypothetical protein
MGRLLLSALFLFVSLGEGLASACPFYRIVISSQTERFPTSYGVPIQVHRAEVHSPAGNRPLRKWNFPQVFGETADVWLGDERVPMPNSLLSRLARYLSALPRVNTIDCLDFVGFLNGFSPKNDWSRWKQRLVSSRFRVKPAQSVLLKRSGVEHALLGLGNGYYLSKFGNDGPLLVSRLPTMRRYYQAPRVFLTTPPEGADFYLEGSYFLGKRNGDNGVGKQAD